MQQRDVKVQQQDVDWSAVQAWPGSTESFVGVQNLLDRNNLIISEIDANHESPTNECLERNEDLIRELNSNINQHCDKATYDFKTGESFSKETIPLPFLSLPHRTSPNRLCYPGDCHKQVVGLYQELAQSVAKAPNNSETVGGEAQS
eukprot:7375323-Pyramimonas_sp.AAC.3